MVEITVTVQNPHGLHARPAALFAKKASECEGVVSILKGDSKGDAKSILSVMSMGISQGMEVTVQAEGSNAEKVLENLREILTSTF